MTVYSMKEAWREADKLFPTDYMKDELRSSRAGYDVYSSTAEGYDMYYICDLGIRLEVNMGNETTNIWIAESPYKEYQIEDALSVISDAIYEIDDKIDRRLAAETGIEEARKMMYAAYAKLASILEGTNENSKLFEKYNLDRN